MCRKEAVELENCAPQEESHDESDDEDEEENDGGVIRISRAGLEYLLRGAGGVGITAGVEAELEFNSYSEIVIARFELARILQEQGGTPLSDAQWTQLITVYPPAEYNDDDDNDGNMVSLLAPAVMTFAEWLAPPPPPINYIDHPCTLNFVRAGDIPPSYGVAMRVSCDACNLDCGPNPFYHCDECQFDVCLPCIVDGAARGFMQRMGY
jgi:hypothetical protein